MRGAGGTSSWILQVIFLAFTSISLGFGILCITTASLSLIFGTQRALMGHQALTSMDIAVDMLKRKAYHTFYFFLAQLIFFFLSAFMVLWGAYPPIVALSGNLVLGLCLYFFATNGFELVGELYVSEDDAVSNKFVEEGQDQGDGMDMFRKQVDVDRKSQDGRSYMGYSDNASQEEIKQDRPSQHEQQVRSRQQPSAQKQNDHGTDAFGPGHSRLSGGHKYSDFFDNF